MCNELTCVYCGYEDKNLSGICKTVSEDNMDYINGQLQDLGFYPVCDNCYNESYT